MGYHSYGTGICRQRRAFWLTWSTRGYQSCCGSFSSVCWCVWLLLQKRAGELGSCFAGGPALVLISPHGEQSGELSQDTVLSVQGESWPGARGEELQRPHSPIDFSWGCTMIQLCQTRGPFSPFLSFVPQLSVFYLSCAISRTHQTSPRVHLT